MANLSRRAMLAVPLPDEGQAVFRKHGFLDAARRGGS